jgi:hypothetical protein
LLLARCRRQGQRTAERISPAHAIAGEIVLTAIKQICGFLQEPLPFLLLRFTVSITIAFGLGGIRRGA